MNGYATPSPRIGGTGVSLTNTALVEIEAPKSGRLVQIFVPVGQVVKMGGTLGIVG